MNDETTSTAASECTVDSLASGIEAPVDEAPIGEAPEDRISGGESGFTGEPSSKSVEDETAVEDDEDDDEGVGDGEDEGQGVSVGEEEEDVEDESADGEDEGPKKPRKKKKKKKGTNESEDGENAEEDRPGKLKGIMEYDLADMYPEVSVLVGKPRREWNFTDPEIIRALWLDSKTNAITDWKIRHGNLYKARQTQVEIPLNHTAQLRLEFQKQKEEQKKIEFNKMEEMLSNGKIAPHFNTVQMATTTTVEMRYKFTRNNPPVPSYYINHYDKYKKPPFKTKVGRPCKNEP